MGDGLFEYCEVDDCVISWYINITEFFWTFFCNLCREKVHLLKKKINKVLPIDPDSEPD